MVSRAITAGVIGAIVGVLAIAGWGFFYGLEEGQPSARIPPGLHGAVNSAFVFALFLWPWGVALGGVIGGMAGFGSALTRDFLQTPKHT